MGMNQLYFSFQMMEKERQVLEQEKRDREILKKRKESDSLVS